MQKRTKELIGLALIGVAITVPFWAGDLDIKFSRLFYDAENAARPWRYGGDLLWRFLYKTAQFIVAAPLALSVSLIVVATVRRSLRHLRIYGLFILLGIAIGPGLVVNTILKENWGHPRPDSIEAFGGKRRYLPPLAKGPEENGEAFPCGHASAGFAYFVFWFVFRQRRRRLARVSLVVALVLGGMLGLGRIVQGRHYLSDVLWSGYICYIVCFILYHYLFRLPTVGNSSSSRLVP